MPDNMDRGPSVDQAALMNERVLERVAAATGVAQAQIISRRRGKEAVSAARQLAMYLCRVSLSATLIEISILYGRHRSTVQHACAAVEDRRDDPDFDRLVSGIEAEIAAWHKSAAEDAACSSADSTSVSIASSLVSRAMMLSICSGHPGHSG